MKVIAELVDDLADALLAALRGAGPGQRPALIDAIRQAIKDARQLDTPNGGGFELETPDELTDLRSLALELRKPDFSPHPVRPAAQALADALAPLRRYGVRDRPWVDVSVEWNFAEQDMALNILLPDPLRRGLWDWRAPFYMNVNPTPVQPHIIDFLQVTDWVDFIDEYHRGPDAAGAEAIFKGLLAAKIPEFPVFNPKFEPPPPPCDDGKPPYPPGKPEAAPPPARKRG
jgi:hypothetical protein